MADQSKLTHIACIMDGNRRWAKQRGKGASDGHRAGYKALKELIRTAKDLNVDYLSVYAFSTENWNRSKEEVEGLMGLARWVMKSEIEEIHKEGIRVRWMGSEDNMPKDILKLLKNAEAKTADNQNGTLVLCFNYGGHQEIVEAVQAAQEAGEEVSAESIESHLYAPDIPPVDLLIRTGGEQRLSNFMLWRAAYAELAFTESYWPDFDGEELRAIIDNYNQRQRRFGV